MRTPAAASVVDGRDRAGAAPPAGRDAPCRTVTMPTFACGLGDDPLVDAVDPREVRAPRRASRAGATRSSATAGRASGSAGRRRAREILPAACPVGLACASRSTVEPALDHLRDRLEADPRAREARQRPAVEAELEVSRRRWPDPAPACSTPASPGRSGAASTTRRSRGRRRPRPARRRAATSRRRCRA